MRQMFTHLKPQLNKDNRGASLIAVLTVASIVTMLMTAILAVVIVNIYMKRADSKGQSTFYDAESAMEEIRVGLSEEVSKAATIAYVDTLSNYSDSDPLNPRITEEQKSAYFNSLFADCLKKRLASSQGDSTGGKSFYDIDLLKGYFVSEQAKERASINTNYPDNVINIETDDGVVLKNVTVSYATDDGYLTEIKTDICLQYPAINFQDTSSMDNILTYGIICSDDFVSRGNNTIQGSAFLGNADRTGETESNDTEDCSITGDISFEKAENQETNILTGGDMNLSAAHLSVDDDVWVWADSLIMNNGSTLNATKTDSGYTNTSRNFKMLLKNDMVLANSYANIGGTLIMFGNPWKVIDAAFAKKYPLTIENMADYSSSIIFNGPKCGLNLKDLTTMVIGGSTYVNTIHAMDGDKSAYTQQQLEMVQNMIDADLGTEMTSDGDRKEQFEVVTGQSMAVKSDQRAYLVPPSLVGRSSVGLDARNDVTDVKCNDFTSEYGGNNPMTTTQWNNLLQDIADHYGCEKSQLSQSAIVDFVGLEPKMNVSLGMFNVSHFKVRAYPLKNSNESMIYLFISFKTIGKDQVEGYIPAEAYANNWYRLYNSIGPNYANLLSNLDYYTPYGIKLPENYTDKSCMYFTGNMITTENNYPIVQDIITQNDFTQDLNAEYSAQSIYYQETYYSLKQMMSRKYENLANATSSTGRPAEDPSSDLFSNLIDDSDGDGDVNQLVRLASISGTGSNNEYFVSTDGQIAYICSDPNSSKKLTEIERNVPGSLVDRDGKSHSGEQQVYLIITAGSIEIDGDIYDNGNDYHGVIIAGGDVTLDNGMKVYSDVENAALALTASKMKSSAGVETEYFVKDCVIYAKYYLVGGLGTTTEGPESYTLSEFVTYRNWKKQ